MRRGNIFFKTLHLLKEQGLSSSSRHLLNRLRDLLYVKRELIVFAADLDQQPWHLEGREPVRVSPLIDVEIRRATRDDLEKFSALVPGRRLKRFREWFEKGYEAFIVLKNEEIIYYQWLAFSDFYHPLVRMNFKLEKDEVCPVDIYMRPEYRMKNIHLAVNSHTVPYCIGRKRFRMISTASPDKFEMFRLMYQRAGMGQVYPVRRIICTRILGLCRRSVEEIETADHTRENTVLATK